REGLHRKFPRLSSGKCDRAGRSPIRQRSKRLLGPDSRPHVGKREASSRGAQEVRRLQTVDRRQSGGCAHSARQYRQRNVPNGRIAGSGMEPARLQSKSRQQSLCAGRARFRFCRKAHSESTPADGWHSNRDQASGSESPASSPSSHGNGDRTDPGRNQSGAQRSRPVAQPGAATEKRSRPNPGKDRQSARRLQKWLQGDLLKRADGDFRLGAEKFRKKLHFALASDLSMEEIKQRANADLEQTQAAIYETALPLHKKYFPKADEKTLADKKQVTAA